MDEPRCVLCGETVPTSARRVGPWFVCRDDEQHLPEVRSIRQRARALSRLLRSFAE